MDKGIKRNIVNTRSKKPCVKSVITRIKLDPKQAVLAVCAHYGDEGAWMKPLGTLCV